MDWSGSSACRLRHGILTEIGRTLPCLSALEHRRKSSFGRKHDFLRIVSVHICEPHLGSDSGLRHRHEKASFLSLKLSLAKSLSKCLCSAALVAFAASAIVGAQRCGSFRDSRGRSLDRLRTVGRLYRPMFEGLSTVCDAHARLPTKRSNHWILRSR